jgi:hypothetical protein
MRRMAMSQCKAELGRSGSICTIPKQKPDSHNHPWQRIASVSPLALGWSAATEHHEG